MITSIYNNIGIEQVSFNDYQSETITVLNARFSVDPTSQAWLAADEIVFGFSSLTMNRSSNSAAFIIDSRNDTIKNKCRRGTILKSWIQGNELHIEKLNNFNSNGPLYIYVCSAYTKGGQRGQIVRDGYVNTGIQNQPTKCKLDKKCMIVKENYVFLTMMFDSFGGVNDTLSQAFDIVGFPQNIDIYVPVILCNPYIQKEGAPMAEGHISGGHFTCRLPNNISFYLNRGTCFKFFAVINNNS